MISPELLRRYTFFAHLNDAQLHQLAIIGEEISLEDGQVVFEEGQPANWLYFLLEGGVDLSYTVSEAYRKADRKEISVCEINVGEPFGISTLIEPHVLTSTAHCSGHCRVIRFAGGVLNQALVEDQSLEALMMRKMAKTAIERLHDTRIQLAACLA
jgi:CRP/FNR family cyclic AMP-dependent transcriptional regulator